MNKRIILHTLNWHMKNITSNLPYIRQSGFTAIQLTPIQTCKDGSSWWTYYQPYSFEIGNRLGTYDDFIELCTEAHKYNIEIYVDVILRHLASKDTGECVPHELCDQTIVRNRDFWLFNGDGNNEKDNWQLCNCNWGLPTLNYYNKDLRFNYYYEFLDKVLAYADGIRLDQGCKHYSLPTDNDSCEMFSELSYLYKDKFIYGEGIFVSQQRMNEYSNYMYVLSSEYDCSTSDNSRNVKFIESHDTNLHFKTTLWMNDDVRLNKWENLLHKYDNVLYYARPFDNTIFCERMKNINLSYNK